MKQVLAVGRVLKDGSTVMEVAEAPRVIDTEAVGDMRVSIMSDAAGVYVALAERIPCRDLQEARRVFNGIVKDEVLDLGEGPSDDDSPF